MTLLFGDCIEMMKTLPDQSVDMCLTDPPYGTTACKWDNIIPFEPMWEQLHRIVKPNGAICLFGSEPFSSRLRMSNLKRFKYDWVWDKVRPVGFQIAKYRPMQRHELISVFCKGRMNYYPIKTKRNRHVTSRYYDGNIDAATSSNPLSKNDRKKRTYTDKNPVSIIVQSNAKQTGKLHPTQKPVALLEYLIKTYTLEGETVLDFAMGSGSTGVACKNLNREFIGIENNAEYFEIAKQRIEKA